jgi:hypothetical protein
LSGDLILGERMIVVDDDRTAALMPGFYRDALTIADSLGRVFTQFGGRLEVLAKLPGAVSGSTSGG